MFICRTTVIHMFNDYAFINRFACFFLEHSIYTVAIETTTIYKYGNSFSIKTVCFVESLALYLLFCLKLSLFIGFFRFCFSLSAEVSTQ